ncbi:MAG: hypothetical protein ACYCX8_09045 [Acidimicrobiales bacterium]
MPAHDPAGRSDRQSDPRSARSRPPHHDDLTGRPGSQPPGAVDGPDDATTALLSLVPELHATYLELVALADDDPGPAAVFAELAALVAGWLATVGEAQPALDRAFRALEAVAEDASEEALELVGYAFFDNLSPDHQRAAQRWIGPSTRAVMEMLDG